VKKFFVATVALVLGLTFAGVVSAHEPRPYVRVARPYYVDHGVRFNGGYYYRGYDHPHWSYRVWDVRCGRYHYYDPCLHVYYYWNPTLSCYYPVGY